MTAPSGGLNAARAALDALRESAGLSGPLDAAPVPGLRLDRDPEAGIKGGWRSPRGRLLEIETRVARPGRWLALHLELGSLDLAALPVLGLFARTAAARPHAIRPCLRSGRVPTREGEPPFLDLFFPRHILAQPGESDHVDLIAPDRRPDLAAPAPWRELVLFLPATEPVELAIHDLRILVP